VAAEPISKIYMTPCVETPLMTAFQRFCSGAYEATTLYKK